MCGRYYLYVYVDGICLRRNWDREFENVDILVAIVVNEDGYGEVLGVAEGMKEDKVWVSFFQWICSRGLDGVKLVVGNKGLGTLGGLWEKCSRSQVPALHRPFLLQCVLCNSSFQGEAGSQNAQGVCSGE